MTRESDIERRMLDAAERGRGLRRYTDVPVGVIEDARSRSSHTSRSSRKYIPTYEEEHPREEGWDDSHSDVVLSRSIFEQLRDHRTGREDGGWLIGPHEQTSRIIECRRAMWSAFEDERASSNLDVNFADADRLNEALEYGTCVVGHWHTQPTSSLPSDRDLETWRRACDHLALDAFVGVTVKERVFGGPVDVRAYVVDKQGGKMTGRISWRK